MTARPNSPYLDWNSVETMQFDWGYIKWITAADEQAPEFPTTGIVVLLPGKGHDRHNHPESHELLYVVAGQGEQMVEDPDGKPIIRPVHVGDAIRIPRGAYHSTVNTGWEPMRLLAMYAPSGAEAALREAPGFRSIPAGQFPPLLAPPRSRDEPLGAAPGPGSGPGVSCLGARGRLGPHERTLVRTSVKNQDLWH